MIYHYMSNEDVDAIFAHGRDQPHQSSEGFDLVVVNGKVAVADGELTDLRAGRFIEHGANAAWSR